MTSGLPLSLLPRTHRLLLQLLPPSMLLLALPSQPVPYLLLLFAQPRSKTPFPVPYSQPT